MFGVLALPFLWQIVARTAFSLLVTAAQKAGVINKVEAGAIRTEHTVASAMENLKVVEEFPTGKNGASSGSQT